MCPPNGAHRESEPLGDLTVAQAFIDQGRDLALARGDRQRTRSGPDGWRGRTTTLARREQQARILEFDADLNQRGGIGRADGERMPRVQHHQWTVHPRGK